MGEGLVAQISFAFWLYTAFKGMQIFKIFMYQTGFL